MKKTQITDTLRNISRQFVSFLSIAVIGMLAVAAYLGINYASDALNASASEYMDRLAFRDIDVTSTMLLTEEDIDAIRSVEGVADAEGVYQVTAKVSKKGEAEDAVVDVLSITERISLPETVEGRLPVSLMECAVEEEIMERLGLKTGDMITLCGSDGGTVAGLRSRAFRITGSFVHADHYAKQAYSAGNRYILLAGSAFDQGYFESCCLRAVVRLEKPDGTGRISKSCDKLMSEGVGRIEALAEERAPMREKAVKDKIREEIEDGRKKLDDAKKELDEAREKLDGSAKEITDKEKELEEAKTTLDNAKKRLDKAERDLAGAQKELSGSRAKLDAAKAELDTAAAELEELYAAAVATGDPALMARYEAALAQYNAKRSEYLAGEQQYSEELSKYNAARGTIDTQKKRYRNGLKQFENGAKEIEEAKKELEDGEKDYAEGLDEYNKGYEELQSSEDKLEGMSSCRWVVLDAYGSAAYVNAKSSAQNIRRLAATFALLFVLVGALVIYATVARIIDEQRTQLGTVKALGLFNGEAAVKYLAFGISATLLGIVLGTALGYFALQRIVLDSHEEFYAVDNIPNSFNITMTVIAAAAGVAIALLSVWSACAELVKLPAVELMKIKMPACRVKASHGKAPKASLYSKLIMRNMRNDVRRIFVTIISVAGCCVLLVIGFTMRGGIVSALEQQYNELLKHDHIIRFDPEASETARQDIQALLDISGVEYSAMHCGTVSFKPGNELNAGPLVSTDQDELDKNFNLTDMSTGKPLILSDHGVYISRRIAVYYHLAAGDNITVYDSGMAPYEVPVEGIYQYYFGTNLIMSRNAYREVFGKDAETDGFLIRNCPDAEALSEGLAQIAGFESIQSNREQYDNSKQAMAALIILIAVLILAAGVMAYFILLNLANMYINQKKRELTIMRVNGFTTRETIAYVAREAVLTTVLGIALGIAAGTGFSYAILRFIEQRQAGYVLAPDPAAWLLSALITALYSFLIYSIALKKVRHLKLTDIN